MNRIKYVGKLSTPIDRKLLHSHDYSEIVRYTTGTGSVEIAGRSYSFAPGDIFIIPPHTPHTDWALQGFQNFHAEFSDEDFPFEGLLIMHDSETEDILTLLTMMFHAYQRKRPGYHQLLDSMYTVLVQYLLMFRQAQHANHPYVDFAVDSINQSYSDPFYDFSVTAAQIPFHPDYFRKIFFADMGCTPTQYLTGQRVQNAKKLLRLRKQTKLSIQEIAWLSGFRDNLYFSRVFRDATGMSPTDYFHAVSGKE